MVVERKNSEQAIGRTKTAFVPKQLVDPFAIITEIIAHAAPGDSGKRLDFRGPVTLDDENIHHLETVVLPIVDEFADRTGLPHKNHVLSIENIGVKATRGKGLKISGFSADLPLFLALLSATLQLPLRQDVISTGHISSVAGDVAPVLDIPTKLEAAVASADISEFVFPDIDKDQSSIRLAAPEFKKAQGSLFRYKDQIKLTAVEDICDVLKAFVTDESIISCGLNQGFFAVTPKTNDLNNPINRSLSYLLSDSEKRFWNVLQDFLFSQGIDKAKNLISSFMQFHIGKSHYPEHFGEQLYRLTMSLPLLTRRLDRLFPLAPIDMCIALSQYAEVSDHSDVQILYKLTSDDEFARKIDTRDEEEATTTDTGHEGQLLRRILFEFTDTNLAEKIGKSLDEARGNYLMKAVTVQNASEFNQAVTGFYTHMMRYTQSPEGHVSRDAAASEAIDIINKAFRDRGGYEAALAEGKNGTKGGLRFIFDVMTDHEKFVKIEKYKVMVIKESIDPLDWDAKVKLAEYIKNHYGRYLPDVFRNMEPEQLAHHLEELILLLAGREENIGRWFRKH